jgi:hypothetical protein
MDITTNHSQNRYFDHGSESEQGLLSDLIEESIQIQGTLCYYIPRTLNSIDEITGEARLSSFEHVYPIMAYLENVQGFGGDTGFLQKFGLTINEQATFIFGKKEWEQFIGQYGLTILARPAEGDLLWLPLSQGLFEIKFVDWSNPFFQLNKLYIYRCQVELFQYASETIDTGIEEIDSIGLDNTFDIQTGYVLLNEIGGNLLDESGNILSQESDIEQQKQSPAKNTTFKKDSADFIQKPNNPLARVNND